MLLDGFDLIGSDTKTGDLILAKGDYKIYYNPSVFSTTNMFVRVYKLKEFIYTSYSSLEQAIQFVNNSQSGI